MPAGKRHADDIARLVMQAMTEECCLFLAGEGNTLDDFRAMMSELASMERSQYSFRNALVAVDGGGKVAGACVAYPGADLRKLRAAFVEAAATRLGRHFGRIEDEAEAGEYYIDSLAVYPQYRRKGIGAALLMAMAAKAKEAGLPAGLLVDANNPNAERLYRSLGFESAGAKSWGGHHMKHLLKKL